MSKIIKLPPVTTIWAYSKIHKSSFQHSKNASNIFHIQNSGNFKADNSCDDTHDSCIDFLLETKNYQKILHAFYMILKVRFIGHNIGSWLARIYGNAFEIGEYTKDKNINLRIMGQLNCIFSPDKFLMNYQKFIRRNLTEIHQNLRSNLIDSQ